MRRLTLTVLLVVAVPLRAELRFERPSADMGEVRSGPVCEHRFEFVNGPVPVEIVGVRRDCGCLDPVLEKKSLAPNEKGTLGFRIRTLGQPEGRRAWLAWVQYREGDELKEVRLSLSARIRNEVTVQPSILALHVENALRQEIVVTDTRTPSLRVTEVRTSTSALKATLLPEGSGVTRVALEVSARDLNPARHEATLEIYTDDPYYGHLQVPVTLTRASQTAVVVTPNVLRVRSSLAQPISTHLVRVRPHGDAKVLVDAVEANDPGITCTWAAGPENGATLKIRVDSRRLTGTHAVRVQLAAPTRETLTIPVIIDADP